MHEFHNNNSKYKNTYDEKEKNPDTELLTIESFYPPSVINDRFGHQAGQLSHHILGITLVNHPPYTPKSNSILILIQMNGYYSVIIKNYAAHWSGIIILLSFRW